MSRQTDRHAERNRVYTQYYVYFCSAVYEYMNTYVHVRTCSCMYIHTCTLPYNKVGRLPMAGSNKRMVTNLEGDSEGEGGNGEN